jgi:hypothetical protein
MRISLTTEISFKSDISFSKDMITEELYDVHINNILLEMDVAIQVLERARSASLYIESEEVDIEKIFM